MSSSDSNQSFENLIANIETTEFDHSLQAFQDTLEFTAQHAWLNPQKDADHRELERLKMLHIVPTIAVAEGFIDVNENDIYAPEDVMEVAGILAVLQQELLEKYAVHQKLPILEFSKYVVMPEALERAEFSGETVLYAISGVYCELLNDNIATLHASIQANRQEKRAAYIKTAGIFLGSALMSLATKSVVSRFRS